MNKTLRKFFIPHKGNNFLPHILHSKRAIFYCLLFLIIKAIVVFAALMLPAQVFVMPDVLYAQQQEIISLTNNLRAQKGLPPLLVNAKLSNSAEAKAKDMVDGQYFSHEGSNGHSLKYFLDKSDYQFSYAGENLAIGFSNAPDIVNAWMLSPTHLANLVGDYKEIGVALEGGVYQGQPTVYVVQHFGLPKINPNATVAQQNINTNNDIIYDQKQSEINWQDNGVINAKAKISGNVQAAQVSVAGYTIPLAYVGNDMYAGSIAIKKEEANAPRAISPAILSIADATSGSTLNKNIPWNEIKITPDNPVQRYLMAKNMLGAFTPLFNIPDYIYLSFIIFFTIALTIGIVVQFKKQHPHIIAQTLSLIVLLVCLYLY